MRFPARATRLAILTGMLVVTACSSDGGDIEGTEWVVVSVGDLTPPADAEATLSYDGEGVAGSTGCNNYTGGATFEDGSAELGALAMTLQACENEISAFEQAFVGALDTVTAYTIDGDILTLQDAGGATVITLTSS